MKKFLKLLKGNGGQAAAPADGNAAPRLNEALSSKARHPSAIPGSFYERDRKFKAQSTTKKGQKAVVVPRTEGPMQFKQGRLASWTPCYARVEASTLVLYADADGAAPAPGAQPIKRIQLVGFHLTASKASKEMTISEKEGGGGSGTVTLSVPSGALRDEWMAGLGAVPGLFRRVEDYYVLGRKWGHGATSEVTEVMGRFTGRRLALKQRIHSTREATSAMHNELRILQICAKHPHPAIPTLEDFFFDTSGRIELVMQLMEGGELFDWIAARDYLTEADAREVFRQVADGVAHLHSIGIAHRDLKPQNVMYATVSEGAGEGAEIKIMDYDLARVNYSPEWQGSTPCGTVHYMAPEVVRREAYSLAVDCWSLGVILYILLCGYPPFYGKNDAAIEKSIERGEYEMEGELWQGVSEEAKDMVRKLLRMEPAERLTAAQCLEHPWLREEAAAVTETNGRPVAGAGSLSKAHSRDHLLRTAENLRQLSQTLPSLAGSRASRGSSRGSFPNLMALSGAVSGASPPVPHPSPLSKALDYDLGPLRRQAAVAAGSGDAVARRGTEGEVVSLLRVSLDLVGTQAGILDSRAAAASGAGADAMIGPSSPTRPIGLLIPPSKRLEDELAELGASYVEEEENRPLGGADNDSSDGEAADGELKEDWG